MRSDHLAKHIKTHENKAKKLMAKKGDKLEKASSKNANPMSTPTTTIIKQEKIEEDEIKPSIFHSVDTSSYMDIAKNGSNVSFSDPTPTSQTKPSIEDYYQSYHPYQYQYGSNYFHQNSRFYQDKNYFHGFEQNRGLFPSPPAATTTPNQPNNPQLTISSVQSLNPHQGSGYYQQSSNSYPNSANTSGDSNYLLNFNASINNTININTSNLMININNTSTNNSNTSYQSQALQQHQQH
jgi:transcription factor Sp